MPKCTVPNILGFGRWFDERFGDLCPEHDDLYALREWHKKVYSDFLISAEIAKRGYAWMGFLAFAWNLFLGTPYWLWKKFRKVWM